MVNQAPIAGAVVPHLGVALVFVGGDVVRFSLFHACLALLGDPPCGWFGFHPQDRHAGVVSTGEMGFQLTWQVGMVNT